MPKDFETLNVELGRILGVKRVRADYGTRRDKCAKCNHVVAKNTGRACLYCECIYCEPCGKDIYDNHANCPKCGKVPADY